MSGLDEKLLANNSSGDGSEDSEAGDQSGSGSGGKEIGAGDLAKSFVKSGGNIEKMAVDLAKDQMKQAAKDPMAMVGKATGNLLKQSWLNLIISFGLTLLYIDLHYFLNAVLGDKAFTKPGHEWAPPVPIGGSSSKAEETAKQLELVENAGCCAANGCCFFLIVLIFTIIYAIVNPVDFGLDLAK